MTNDLRRSRLIAESLLDWFKANKREFPWRDSFANPDPFVILFTEIMLQRTKADQVVPVYVEFVKRYPSFEALRSASSDEVASLFNQLGLAWRAKNLVNLIRVLEERYRGEIPQTFSALRELPGIGDYVAKAVLCYAFGQSVVPIDTNVVRVVSRLFGIDISADRGRRNKTIAQLAQSLVAKDRPREFNLALLDFAAQVCKPKPLCKVCPLSEECEYFHEVFLRECTLPRSSLTTRRRLS